ncbi:MAG: hypothetical protein U9R72_15530 [Chloroflexota bacterium]|nr:hypothetical protein [Chloroflexota bacterium]
MVLAEPITELQLVGTGTVLMGVCLMEDLRRVVLKLAHPGLHLVEV